MASERPIIIPELLKELVYREIESSGIPKERASERSKLAQKCYLASLKLIKSHIVSGVKEPSLENPLEDLHELLLSRGRSAHVHKLNRLYDRLSNLSLSIPELNNHPQRILGAGPASQSRSQRNTFQDQFLRLLVPLFDTGSRDNDNQENFNNNIKVSNDLQNSISPVLSRFRDQSLQLASTSSCSIAEGGGGRGGGRLEAYSGESGQVASNDDYSVPLFVLEKCLLSPTQELALVHDILYALQGFDAQFVKYDVSTDSYILSPSVYSLETTRELVTEICHFGTIYKRMTKVLSYYRRELERPHLMERSMLTKTLVEFIQDLLSEYSQFIVSQQNEVQESMIALSKLDPGVNPNLELLSSSKPMLTLRRLLHRMDDQYHKREKVFAVLEGLLGQTSSSILSCLNVQRRNGNQHHEKIFESLFHKCVSVWIHDLNLILRYGTSIRYLDGIETKNMRTKTRVDFENRLGEFFIKGSLEEGIKVDESRIPNFLLLETAYQIAHLCKTRIMIRTLLAQDEDARLAEELEVFELSSETISDLNRIPLHSILNGLQDKLDTKLRDLVLGQGSLVSSLQGLRDSLVCFNGDFSDLLLRNLESELDKPSESVSLQNLEELFESTIRSCPWFNSIGGNLQVSILEDQVYNKPGSCGWDVFTLDLPLQERTCLALVLTPDLLRRYRRIFKTVWKLKLVIHKLNSAWTQLVKYLRQAELCAIQDSADTTLLRNSSCLIRTLIIALSAIQNLLSFSSVSYLWSSLEEQIPKTTSLNQIIDLHDTYLSYIESTLFISSRSPQEQKLSQDIYLCLDLILESSLFLCKINKTLLNSLLIYENDHGSNQVPNFETNHVFSSLTDEIYESSNNLQNCFTSFRDNLNLMIQLKHDTPQFDPHLQTQIYIFESLMTQLSTYLRFLDE